jgi:RimJ/RimL family protein N-acetyltransferase
LNARIPLPTTLAGRFVTLEPLRADLLPALFHALRHTEVYAGGWGGGPAARPATEQDFLGLAGRFLRWDDGRVFAVSLASGPDAGAVVGTTTLADFEPAREAVHLGWTAYDPQVWGSVVNPECKLLLLGHCFDHGFGRVKIQTDVLNTRSREAILRLGATFEGVTRRDARRADGTWRDAAVHSVVVDDWPRVRQGLLERLSTAVPATLSGARPTPQD